MSKKINLKIVLILLLLIIAPFYSFLAWKMSRTSNHFVSDPKFIAKSFFTWNPAELFNNIYNKWDSLYLYKKGVKPASDFNSMKNTLEKEVGGEIYFAGLSNGIFFDDNGEVFSNEGGFILKEDDEYNYYSYNIYIDDKKAEKSYESDKRIGLEIFKKPGTVSVENIEKYKIFSNAALTALGQVVDDNFMKNAKLLSVSSFGEDFQMIQTADENLKPIKTIEFDYLGNIIPEKKEIDYRAQEANATKVDNESNLREPESTTNTNIQNEDDSYIPKEEENINENTREALVVLPIIDKDGDGLSLEEEQAAGTSDELVDTDGDGYPDLAEMLNGYNPTGDGFLIDSPYFTELINKTYSFSFIHPKSFKLTANSDNVVVFDLGNGEFFQIIIDNDKEKLGAEGWYKGQSNVPVINESQKSQRGEWSIVRNIDNKTMFLKNDKDDYIVIFKYFGGEGIRYANMYEIIFNSFKTSN